MWDQSFARVRHRTRIPTLQPLTGLRHLQSIKSEKFNSILGGAAYSTSPSCTWNPRYLENRFSRLRARSVRSPCSPVLLNWESISSRTTWPRYLPEIFAQQSTPVVPVQIHQFVYHQATRHSMGALATALAIGISMEVTLLFSSR